jgi:hypothetical protein
MDKVQQNNYTYCLTPSSETFIFIDILCYLCDEPFLKFDFRKILFYWPNQNEIC